MQSLDLNKDLYYKILDYAEAKGYSANTIKAYSTYLKRIFKKNKVLDEDVLRRLLKKIKHQNQRAALVLINDYCYYSKIDFNMVIPKMKAKPRSLPKRISKEEIKIMVESAPYPYDLMIRCIYNIGSGLRISEGIKLSWSHINWTDWLNAGAAGYGVCMIKEGKGSKDRELNVPRGLMQDLYSYAKKQNILNEFQVPTGGMLFDCDLDDYEPEIFINNRKKWKEMAIKHAYDWFRYNIIKKYCEKALGHKINIHNLRHSKATDLLEEGVPIERIQKLLGHSDIKTTLIYTQISNKDTFEMIKDVEEV